LSDFFLFFGSNHQSFVPKISSFLKFFDDTKVFVFKNSAFSMVLTRVDNTDLWGPFESVDDGILISLVGRIALSEERVDWHVKQSFYDIKDTA